MKHALRTLTVLAIISLPTSAYAQLAPDVRSEIESQMKAGDYKAAVKKIEAARDAGDESFETNELLIEAYYMRMDQVGMLKKKSIAGKMKKALERSVAMQPKNSEALGNLAQFHMEAPGIAGGDKDEAKRLIDKIIGLDPVKGHKLGAELARIQDEPEAALSHIENALVLEPQNTALIQMKGVVQAAQGNYDLAITTFEACRAIEPDNLECLYQIGKTSQLGDVQRDKGIKAFKSFIETGHDNKNFVAHAHYRLGNLYVQSGDEVSAKVHYDAAIEINDLKDAKDAKKKLD